ncbi:DUF3108 domain-containing protein [Glaciimonas sp. Gout2]|uniref:DUF3108 domain-containing protein n=1 Tax=unclassified Glaciimonas TaxID=2644401 RepID=UPI002B23813E|nr:MULTISPECIES: DUF3108 domain-containing protein [unclassified Glaciimonas]MEB0014091.1 DUF3108 domain-containing protein [Glaciimonas sp. Cout2]MEB0083423.1 DUF3108 domain-containing protein [Glaciimonas sp. Gout2]
MTRPSTDATKDTRNIQPNRTASRGWLIVLAASLLLHLFLINWGSNLLTVPKIASDKSPVIIAELKPLPPVDKPILAPKPIPPKPSPVLRKVQRKTADRPQSKPSEPEVPDMPIKETRTPIPNSVSDNITNNTAPAAINGNGPETASTGDASSGAPVQPVPKVEPVAPPPPTAVHYDIKPPPSAELKYDVEALNKGQTYHGGGKITWQTDGTNYTINGEAGVLFISALDFKSEGEINAYGVAPVLYTEKKFRKPATSTHFLREPNNITFSASANSYPRTGGEQDRASIVWQLASIGRGDAGKIVPGGVIDLFVAGDKDAETWRFQILGQEEIKVGTGTVMTWHLARKPQKGSYEKTLDIWLAPQQQWYPVKLRFTENNGDYLDMSLSKLKLLN